MTKQFQVLENFDPSKNYPIDVQTRFKKCMALFKQGDILTQVEFAKLHQEELGIRVKGNDANALWITRKGFQIDQKIGIIKEVDINSISFKDFCQFETVEYYSKQLRGVRYKNLKVTKKAHSTKEQYLYRLYEFNNWLHGKAFEFSKIRYIDENTFKKEKTQIKLDNVEQFLKLFQESMNTDSEFIKIIKRYLMDDIHGNVSSGYMKTKKHAIIGYFEKNDSPLLFHYNPSVLYNDEKEDEEIKKLSLEDVLNMLTTGKASTLDRAVVLCKYHRGLDNATFADRFNF